MITVKKATKEEANNAKLNIEKLRDKIAQMHANKLLNIKKDSHD